MTGSDDAPIPAKARRSNPRWSHPPTDRRYGPNSQQLGTRRRHPNSAGLPVEVSRSDRRSDGVVEGTGPPAVPARAGGRGVSTYSRQRAIRIASGRWHPWADPAPARAHVRRLRDQGASYQAIAEAAGLGVMTVHAIVNRRGRVTARTATALLAISDTDVHRARLDAGGTRLRLRALQVMGHSSARIARAIGAREQAIQKITRSAARTVSQQLRDAVAEIYDTWWDKRAAARTRYERSAVSAARRRAIRGNWCPGAGLDEDELDIPGYQPVCGWRPARGTGVAEDITPPRRGEGDPPRLLEPRADGKPATGTGAGSRSGGRAVNSIWEQKIELARAKRLARAREFAARRGMSRQAGAPRSSTTRPRSTRPPIPPATSRG